MNLNDSINALFKHGVVGVTLAVTDKDESVVVVKQQFSMSRGGGDFQHQHVNSDWMLAVQDATKASEHIAALRSAILKIHPN